MISFAAIVAELQAAGLSGDNLVAAVKRIEATQIEVVDDAAERRRAYDRERKRKKAAEIPPESAEQKQPTEKANSTGIPPESTGNPQMRDIDIYKTTNSNSSDKSTIPQRASYPPEFEELWTLFPRKVGKDDAFRSWKKVRGRIEHDALKTAISKHAALVAGKEKQFIPHPATWLNDGRWQDEELQPAPEPVTHSGGKVWINYATPQGQAWEAFLKGQGKIPTRDGRNGWWQPGEWPPDQTAAMKRTA